jgi:site-specific recombinase XerD
MLEELQRRNYSSETIRAYLFAVKDFAKYFGKRPDLLRQEHLRQYQLHLLNERKLTVDTIVGRIAALRFFFVKVFADGIGTSIWSTRNARNDSQ